MKRLERRNALLTGASGGLGHQIAHALAGAGVNLVLSARDEGRLDALASELRGLDIRAEPVAADLADPAARGALPGRAEAAIGPLDLLVNNAGIELVEAYATCCSDDLARILAVNLEAPMELTRLVLPGMLERGEGHVVNVASLSARMPPAYGAAYSASKAGLVALTHSLRAEHAGSGVGFSAICPGFVEGEGMYARLIAEGLPVPRAMGASPPKKVNDALLNAIRRDRAETIVSGRPVRPLIAAGIGAPKLGARMLAASGIHRYFERIAALDSEPG